jgi:divalent metal cation (Fe/Co/Zn/Cd) transporter
VAAEVDSDVADGPPPRRTRVHVGELISAGSALLLLVLMFATAWYGVAGVPDPSYARPAISGAEDGWNGLTVIRWVILVTIIAAIGSVFLHASQRAHGTKTDTSRLIAALGTASSLLLIYRVLIVLPGGGTVIDQKLGAVLGLVCALGIAWGGYESILERRARAGDGPHPPRQPAHRRRRSPITPGRRSQ